MNENRDQFQEFQNDSCSNYDWFDEIFLVTMKNFMKNIMKYKSFSSFYRIWRVGVAGVSGAMGGSFFIGEIKNLAGFQL